MVVGQNPGEEEEASGVPFVGATGTYMGRHFFPPAGLARGEVSIANTYRCRWQGENELPELKTQLARQAMLHCTQAHFKVPNGTRLIVAQGAYALYMLTGEGLGKGRTVSGWRGYALPYTPAPRTPVPSLDIWTPRPTDLPVLVTLHLAALLRDMSMYPALQHDWAKVPLMLAGKWPVPMPPIEAVAPSEWPEEIAFDTEYNPVTRELHRFSVAGEAQGATRTWVVEAHDAPYTTPFTGVKRVWTQNAWADLPYWRRFGGQLTSVEDTMLAHSVLWSDMPHDLEFLGSLYGLTNRWKHLMYGNPTVYAGADAFNTLAVGQSLQRQLARDPGSEYVYRHAVLPLIPIIERAEADGQLVDQVRAKLIARALAEKTKRAAVRAQAVVGWPINIGSPPQVARELYDIAGVK